MIYIQSKHHSFWEPTNITALSLRERGRGELVEKWSKESHYILMKAIYEKVEDISS